MPSVKTNLRPPQKPAGRTTKQTHNRPSAERPQGIADRRKTLHNRFTVQRPKVSFVETIDLIAAKTLDKSLSARTALEILRAYFTGLPSQGPHSFKAKFIRAALFAGAVTLGGHLLNDPLHTLTYVPFEWNKEQALNSLQTKATIGQDLSEAEIEALLNNLARLSQIPKDITENQRAQIYSSEATLQQLTDENLKQKYSIRLLEILVNSKNSEITLIFRDTLTDWFTEDFVTDDMISILLNGLDSSSQSAVINSLVIIDSLKFTSHPQFYKQLLKIILQNPDAKKSQYAINILRAAHEDDLKHLESDPEIEKILIELAQADHWSSEAAGTAYIGLLKLKVDPNSIPPIVKSNMVYYGTHIHFDLFQKYGAKRSDYL